MILDARTSVLPMHNARTHKKQLCIFVLLAVCALHCCSRALFRRAILRRAPTHTQAGWRGRCVYMYSEMARAVGNAARVSESNAHERE